MAFGSSSFLLPTVEGLGSDTLSKERDRIPENI